MNVDTISQFPSHVMDAHLVLATIVLLSQVTSFAQSTSVSSVSFSFSVGCASSTGGEVKCWGNGPRTGLELADRFGLDFDEFIGDEPNEMGTFLPTVKLGTNRTVQQLADGSSLGFMCALLENGDIKCWGLDYSGGLGGASGLVGGYPGEMGDNLQKVNLGTGRFAVQVALGMFHACAILDNGDVKCWGSTNSGRLGLGNTGQSRVGRVPEDMGDALLPVNLGTGRTALQVACGERHTCVVLDNHQVKCWGQGLYGQLGSGTNASVGETDESMGDNLTTVDVGENRSVVRVDCGYRHTCALLDNHKIKCWGEGAEGRLGNGRPDQVGNEENQMGDFLPEVDVGTNLSVVQLSVGSFHTCVLLSNKQIKCFGTGSTGQLGLGNPDSVGAAPNQMGDALPYVDLGENRSVVFVRAGYSRTCAALDDGALKCWGFNFDGQLGSGDKVIRGRTPNTMGDDLPIVDLAFGQPAPSQSPTSSPSISPSKSPSASPTRLPTDTPTVSPITSSPTPLPTVAPFPSDLVIGIALGSSAFFTCAFLVARFNRGGVPHVVNTRNSLQQDNVRYQGSGISPMAVAVSTNQNEGIPVAKVLSP